MSKVIVYKYSIDSILGTVGWMVVDLRMTENQELRRSNG